jgi:hypothetical protein
MEGRDHMKGQQLVEKKRVGGRVERSNNLLFKGQTKLRKHTINA